MDNTEKLTPENTTPQAPEAPAAPVVQPQAPTQPVTPEVPQAPVTPPTAPVAPSRPTQSPLNTTQTIAASTVPNIQPAQAQPGPVQGAYIPPSMNPARIAKDTYQEDPMQRAHHMREILAKQEKTWVMVPLQPGEKPGTALPVGINGYFVYIKKNVMVQVPISVAELVANSIKLDYDNGAEFDLSKNEDKQRALA